MSQDIYCELYHLSGRGSGLQKAEECCECRVETLSVTSSRMLIEGDCAAGPLEDASCFLTERTSRRCVPRLGFLLHVFML